MAMVFKSEKKSLEKIEKSIYSPGPGEYLPLTIYKDININKEPFLSSIKKTFHKKENNPGPGSYYQDDTMIKCLKNIQNEKITDNNKKYFYQPKNSNDKNEEKLGFNIKSKRFDEKISELKKEPGPGYYFPIINKYYKNKIKKIKEDEFNSKQKQSPIYIHLNIAPSIPNKNQKFGFDISEDGKIIPIKDPNLYKTFSGEKGDSVGPDAYEIEKKNNLYRTRPNWTLSKEIRNCYITNFDNLSKIEPPQSLISTNNSDHSNSNNTFSTFNNFNKSNLLSSITANKFYVDDKLNVIELSPHNINISDDSGINFQKSIYFQKKTENYNKSISSNNISSSRNIFNKINDYPGPGFYIDRYKHSSFRYIEVPENKQFFGSKLKRFASMNEISDNNKKRENISFNGNKVVKSKSYIAPFLSTEKRFHVHSYEKNDYPSPSHYNIKIKKIKSFSKNDKFDSSSKRFLEYKNIKWRNDIPGPGYYNPDKIRKHISTKKIIKNENKKHKESPNYINYINYDSKTIEYENKKKLNSTNLKNVTFFRCNPSNEMKKSLSSKNIGPSSEFYYHDKKYQYKQIFPPFHISKEKKLEFVKNNDIKIGPGQYNLDSYFDWNKKTFNISYI